MNGIFVESVTIRNFKSVRDLELRDCRRVNLFIGRPNVGKSNILEAISLFDIPFMVGVEKNLKPLLRAENPAELFHFGDSASPASVALGRRLATLCRNLQHGISLEIRDSEDNSQTIAISPSLEIASRKRPAFLPDVHSYFFPKDLKSHSDSLPFLTPPFGYNLMQMVAKRADLKESLGAIFHSYGLKLMFDTGSQQIMAMREDGEGVFLMPFRLLADSLRRLIFYKTAIHSNSGKILCFEEPEAHTFPPYITSVVSDVIASEDNQFFITTHSPYVVNALIEACDSELAIHVVDIKDGATIARRLDEEDIQRVYDNGIDLFFNIEAFEK